MGPERWFALRATKPDALQHVHVDRCEVGTCTSSSHSDFVLVGMAAEEEEVVGQRWGSGGGGGGGSAVRSCEKLGVPPQSCRSAYTPIA